MAVRCELLKLKSSVSWFNWINWRKLLSVGGRLSFFPPVKPLFKNQVIATLLWQVRMLNETRKVFSFAFEAARGAAPLPIESCTFVAMNMVVHRGSRAMKSRMMRILGLFQTALVFVQFEEFSFIVKINNRPNSASWNCALLLKVSKVSLFK